MEKKTLWTKKLDLVFAYLFIFLCGVAIVLAVTSYLNGKVQEFTETSILRDIES